MPPRRGMSVASCFVLGAAAIFVMGACNAVAAELFPAVAATTTRLLAMAQLQYLFVGYALFCGWAALYYWLARTLGSLGEQRGIWSFWLMFIGFNFAFFPSALRSARPPLPSDALRLFAGNGSLEACSGAYLLAVGFSLSVWNLARTAGQRSRR